MKGVGVTPLEDRPAPSASPARRVLVLSDAQSDRNGVGSYYSDLAAHLGGKGQSTELICPGLADRRWDGLVRFPLPGDSTQRVVFPPAARILRHARKLRPDVIISATPGPYGLLGPALARRYGARLVVGFHTSFQRVTGLYWNRLFNSVTQWYFDACDRLLFKTAKVVVANSEDMAQLARSLGASDVRVIGTPLPLAYLSEPPQLKRDGPLDVLFAGRLAAEKNVLSVVDAAAACPHMRFRIAGDGPLARTVARRADELPNLDYLGWLGRDQLCRLLDTTDLLVLPSHVEAFGTAALEGMARGRNVLVSESCGILEWPDLERGLFRMSTSEDVASALNRIESLDPALRLEKARIARKAALDLHEATLGTWLDLLHVSDGD